MKGSRSAAASEGGGNTNTKLSVTWPDQPESLASGGMSAVKRRDQSKSLLSRIKSAVTGKGPLVSAETEKDPLVSGSVTVPNRWEEARQLQPEVDLTPIARQESYLRDGGGSQYSLGRLTYMSVAEPGDEQAIAAMTTHVGIDPESLPLNVVSAVRSIEMPVEPGSVLSQALSRSQAASAAAAADAAAALAALVAPVGSPSGGNSPVHDP